MSRRVLPEPEFGSDSFLDVIANIVGILIILIVVAGMKVARQEVMAPDTASVRVSDTTNSDGGAHGLSALPQSSDSTAELRAELKEAEKHEASLRLAASHTEAELAAVQDLVTEAVLRRDTEAADADHLHSQISEAEAQHSLLRAQLASLSTDGAFDPAADEAEAENQKVRLQLETDLQEVDERTALIRRTLGNVVDQEEQIQQELTELSRQTAALRELLDSVPPPQTTVLNHRLAPVARTSPGNETHFRIAEDRVSHVPIRRLLDRVGGVIGARSDVLSRFGRVEGEIGPVEGYRMSYSIRREDTNPLASLQMGIPRRPLSVHLRFLPTEPLGDEPVDASLRPGSRLRQIVESLPRDEIVTFWLYPDQFRHYRRFSEYVHSLGLRVAARPLPEGRMIEASQSGTASAGQ